MDLETATKSELRDFIVKLLARVESLELELAKAKKDSSTSSKSPSSDIVEPTNNHAEQQVRHCVIDRKITQGTRRLVGQRYHERMWTAIATCGKQNRSFFAFLQQAIEAKLSGKKTPSLLKP